MFPKFAICAARSVGTEWLEGTIPLPDRLDTEILPVRGLHSFHILILRAEDHLGAEEVGFECFAPLCSEEFLLIFEKTVFLEIRKHSMDVIDAKKGIAMRKAFQLPAPSRFTATFVLNALEHTAPDIVEDYEN